MCSGRGRRCVTRIWASGRPGPGRRCWRRCGRCGRAAPPGIAARRHHRDRRLQPAEALLVDDGGTGARRHPGAGLCRRGGGRARLRAGARRGALRRGRGPGAGRQDPVGVGPAAEAREDGLRRARGCATTTTPICTRSTTSSPTAARRWRRMHRAPAGSIARSRPARARTPRSSSTRRGPPGNRRASCSRPRAASAPAPTRWPSTS